MVACLLFIALLGSRPTVVRGEPSLGVGNRYNAPTFVPGAWSPLSSTLINDTAEQIDGRIEMPVTGPRGTIIYQIPVAVPAYSHYRTTFNVPLTLPGRRAGKDVEAGQVSIIRWVRSRDIAQTVLLMRPLANAGDDAPRRSVILNLIANHGDDLAPQDPTMLPALIDDVTGSTPMIWSNVASTAATHPAAYDSCLLVVLHLADAQALNPAQRNALLAYVRRGGTLLVAAPSQAAQMRDSWLDAYLPVQPVGVRLATHLMTAQHGDLKFASPVTICEAVAAEGSTTLLNDDHYIHAAFKPLGLGRVAFTSFPVDAMPSSGEWTRDFWQSLLNFASPDPSWAATRFPQEQAATLRTMIGLAAPSRAAAIAIAGGVVVLMLVMQLLWRGTRRPRAFAGGMVAALAVSGVLVFLGLSSQQAAALTGGRITLVKLGQSGGGLMQELAAFTGDAPDLALTTSRDNATVRPVAFDAATPPVVEANPYGAPRAGAAAKRIDRIWQADAPLPAGITATAIGRFDATGFHISIDNHVGGTIAAPLLVRRSRIYRLPQMPAGESTFTLTADDRNLPAAQSVGSGSSPAQQGTQTEAESLLYLNGGTLINDQDKTRAAIASALFKPTHGTLIGGTVQPPSMIVGWVDDTAIEPLMRPSATPVIQKSLNAVMFPMILAPAAPGAAVKIDGGMTTLVPGPIPMPVYDAIKGVWLPTNLPGEWLIGVRAPREIGKLVPTRGTLHLNLLLPVQTLTISRATANGGKVAANSAGETLDIYSRTFGSQAAKSFAITPADVDAAGVVWLRLKIETPQTIDAAAPFWSVTDFSVDLEGHIAPQ
jgi:hypothetical protein